jgi:hypothetical protein
MRIGLRRRQGWRYARAFLIRVSAEITIQVFRTSTPTRRD